MFFYPFNMWRQTSSGNMLILDFKYGDVNGDGVFDNVYLIGEKNFGIESGFIENIRLVIIDGGSYSIKIIPLKSDAGYNPRIFLGDFTGNSVNEILISIFSGGSGGMSWYYIYSYLDNNVKKIFDYEIYNNEYDYVVNYKDDYKVEIINKKLYKKYIIDIEYKGQEYLSKLYDESGKLKEPTKGYVNPLSGLYPIDYQGDGVYELSALRRVIGLYNADTLGVIQTALEWDGNKFVTLFENVGVYGMDVRHS